MKYIYTLLICTCLTACGDGYDKTKCFIEVQKHYNTTDVEPAPDKNFTFIVRKQDGSVVIAKTMGTDTRITSEEVLFKAKQ